MPSGGNTTFQPGSTTFQPGSAPAVPGKSGVPSIGKIGSQDMASTGTAPKEVSLAPHVSSVQGGIVISVSKCLASHVQGGVTPVCTAESLCARFQRDLSIVSLKTVLSLPCCLVVVVLVFLYPTTAKCEAEIWLYF